MKTKYIVRCIAVLCAVSCAPLKASGPQFFKAEAAGIVQTQILLSPSDGRIRTATLDNKRIFAEFQVSKTDYELVVSLNSGVQLLLLPKAASANLPTLTVLEFGNNTQRVIDSKAGILTVVYNTAPSMAANLFKDLDGEIIGTAHYKGVLYVDSVVTSFTFRVIGQGTDLNSASGAAVLRFRVTTKGAFSQAP